MLIASLLCHALLSFIVLLFSVLFVIPYSYWLLILFVVEVELVAVGESCNL